MTMRCESTTYTLGEPQKAMHTASKFAEGNNEMTIDQTTKPFRMV